MMSRLVQCQHSTTMTELTSIESQHHFQQLLRSNDVMIEACNCGLPVCVRDPQIQLMRDYINQWLPRVSLWPIEMSDDPVVADLFKMYIMAAGCTRDKYQIDLTTMTAFISAAHRSLLQHKSQNYRRPELLFASQSIQKLIDVWLLNCTKMSFQEQIEAVRSDIVQYFCRLLHLRLCFVDTDAAQLKDSIIVQFVCHIATVSFWTSRRLPIDWVQSRGIERHKRKLEYKTSTTLIDIADTHLLMWHELDHFLSQNLATGISVCSVCNLTARMTCKSCRIPYYCNVGCQKSDWNNHKLLCQLYTICINTHSFPNRSFKRTVRYLNFLRTTFPPQFNPDPADGIVVVLVASGVGVSPGSLINPHIHCLNRLNKLDNWTTDNYYKLLLAAATDATKTKPQLENNQQTLVALRRLHDWQNKNNQTRTGIVLAGYIQDEEYSWNLYPVV